MRLLSVSLLLILTAASSCTRHISFSQEQRNTSTAGNPLKPVTPGLLFAVCDTLHRCDPGIALDRCQTEFSQTSGIDLQLGLPSQYGTLASIAQAEQAGILTGNSAASDGCFASITQLSCQDPRVSSAYNPAATVPFSGAIQMISGQACGQVFTPIAEYSCSSQVFLRGTSQLSLSPKSQPAGLTYSISPALPTGLTLNPSSGVISGVPTALAPATNHIVTASSPGGNSTTQISIRVADGFLVNDLGDAPDASSGDGSCRTTSGSCTLRAALAESNAGASAIAIVVPAGTLLPASPLSVTRGVELFGNCAGGTRIDGQNAVQPLRITAGPTLVSDLTIENGSVVASSTGSGGGIWINNGGTSAIDVTLENLVVRNNRVTGSAIGGGGGIYAGGWNGIVNLAFRRSLIEGNGGTGVFEGGGFYIHDAGPGVHASVESCTFIRNSAPDTGHGGALSSHARSLTITGSLFQDNTGGRGALALSTGSGVPISVYNSTFYSNDGAVEFNSPSAAEFRNNTFARNSAGGMGVGAVFEGSGAGAISLVNNILSENTDGSSSIRSCSSGLSFVSLGHNLNDSTDCSLTSPGDLTSTLARLGVLQNNGGLTDTLALLSGSPARNSGDDTRCPAADQRGAARLTDGLCDIGAFESQ
jgi:hypothetical protein